MSAGPAVCYGCREPLGRKGDQPMKVVELFPRGKVYVHDGPRCSDRALRKFISEANLTPPEEPDVIRDPEGDAPSDGRIART